MSISSTIRKAGPYIGNGATTRFPFFFKIFKAGELTLTRLDASGTETVLTLGTDYQVQLNAGQDNNPGGTVTLTTPLASGTTLTITSAVPQLQPMVLTNLGGFYPEVINDAADRAVILVQQLKEQVDRSIKFAVSDNAPNAQLPPAAQRAWTLLGFDDAGNIKPMGTDLVMETQYGADHVGYSPDISYGPGSVGHAIQANASAIHTLNTALLNLRLEYVSGQQISLVRVGGPYMHLPFDSGLVDAGGPYTINIDTSNAIAYIYAQKSGNSLTLIKSSTAPIKNNNGLLAMNGNTANTLLVGVVNGSLLPTYGQNAIRSLYNAQPQLINIPQVSFDVRSVACDGGIVNAAGISIPAIPGLDVIKASLSTLFDVSGTLSGSFGAEVFIGGILHNSATNIPLVQPWNVVDKTFYIPQSLVPNVVEIVLRKPVASGALLSTHSDSFPIIYRVN